MSDDVYVRMCRGSPVQKEWKPKRGDNGYSSALKLSGVFVKVDVWAKEIELLLIDGEQSTDFGYHTHFIWLPRQEDWQEIWEEKGDDIYPPLRITDVVTGCSDNKYYHGILRNCCDSYSEWWTVLWCLFVHKEVYGLTWDWDNKKWVKV